MWDNVWKKCDIILSTKYTDKRGDLLQKELPSLIIIIDIRVPDLY